MHPWMFPVPPMPPTLHECADRACRRKPTWTTVRVDKTGTRAFCDEHFAARVAKYELTECKRIKG